MWSEDSTDTVDSRSGVAGLAWVGAICGTFKYSICEEHGGFESVSVYRNFNAKIKNLMLLIFYLLKGIRA